MGWINGRRYYPLSPTSKFDPALEMSRMYRYVMDRGDGLKGQIRENSGMNMQETSQSRRRPDSGEDALSIEPSLAVYMVLRTSYRAAVNILSCLGEEVMGGLAIRDTKKGQFGNRACSRWIQLPA